MLNWWTFFSIQTVGASIMFWRGVPFYRGFISGEFKPDGRNTFWVWIILALSQPAFWWGRKYVFSLEGGSPLKVIAGHMILFVGRLVLVFMGSLCTVVFYARDFQVHLTQTNMYLLALLFAMFCYSLDLEKLGKALISDRN